MFQSLNVVGVKTLFSNTVWGVPYAKVEKTHFRHLSNLLHTELLGARPRHRDGHLGERGAEHGTKEG